MSKEENTEESQGIEIDGISSNDRFATSKLLKKTMDKTGLNSFHNIITEDSNDFLNNLIANEFVNMQAEAGADISKIKATKPEEHDVAIDLKKMIQLTKSHKAEESSNTIQLPKIENTTEKVNSISLRTKVQSEDKVDPVVKNTIKLR